MYTNYKDRKEVRAGTKVPPVIKLGLEKAIQKGIYLNYSDFIRDAIKEKLLREYLLQSTILNEGKE